MLIVYTSKTGNVQRFISKLEMRTEEIYEGLLVNEDFILVTYTIGFGEVPEIVKNFLKDNSHNIKGVISSGNKNWADKYGRAGDIISKQYNIPLICKIELSATTKELLIAKEGIEAVERHLIE